MKTNILITTAIFLLGFLFIPNLSTANTSTFKSAISKSIKYPAFASEKGLEATVWMEMTVLEDGTIDVKATNHVCCQEFLDQVVEQLDGKKIKKFDPTMVGEHHVKFVFSIKK